MGQAPHVGVDSCQLNGSLQFSHFVHERVMTKAPRHQATIICWNSEVGNEFADCHDLLAYILAQHFLA